MLPLLFFSRTGFTLSPSPNRTTGQCTTYADHVPPTCPTRSCSSPKPPSRTKGAVHSTRNTCHRLHIHGCAIRKCPDLFVLYLSLFLLTSIHLLYLTASKRSFTPIKAVGDGSFGTVWLCDWHGPLPPNTPMAAMQSVAGTRPEYANMRLVAVKRMKKRWEGGWDECRKLKEIEVCIGLYGLGSSPLTTPSPLFFLFCQIKRHYSQYPLIHISYPYTIHFFFQTPRSSISSSSQWKGIYFSSSSLVVAVLLLVGSLPPFFVRLFLVCITSTSPATFIGT